MVAYKFKKVDVMKEICLINKGDSVSKLNYSLGIDASLLINNDTMHGCRYVTIEEGDNSVQIVRNYNPYFITNNMSVDVVSKFDFNIVAKVNKHIIFHKSSGVKYVVKPLETIENICNKFDVDKEYIITTNNLKSTKLFVGQILII